MRTDPSILLGGLGAGVIGFIAIIYLGMLVLSIVMIIKFFQMCRHVREMKNLMRDTGMEFTNRPHL